MPSSMAELAEPCVRIAAAAFNELVVGVVLRAWDPTAVALSPGTIEDVERDRKSGTESE